MDWLKHDSESITCFHLYCEVTDHIKISVVIGYMKMNYTYIGIKSNVVV